MASNSETKKTTETSSTAESANPAGRPRFVLLLELENTVIKGRAAQYDLLKTLLGEQGVQFEQVMFSRLCLVPRLEFCVATMLEAVGARKIQLDRFLEDVNGGMAMYYASQECRLDATAAGFIEAAMMNGGSVGVMSALPAETAGQLMDRLGLAQRGIRLFTFEDVDERFPRADTWLHVAKQFGVSPGQCLALCSSAAACRSSLAAGLRCVAVPDEFTAFQDFGGAEMVLASPGSIEPSEVITSLFPQPQQGAS